MDWSQGLGSCTIHLTPAPLAPLGLPPPVSHLIPKARAPAFSECPPHLCLSRFLCHLGKRPSQTTLQPCYPRNAGGAHCAPLRMRLSVVGPRGPGPPYLQVRSCAMASFVSLTRHSLTTYYVQDVGTHTAGAHTQPGLLSQTPGLSS